MVESFSRPQFSTFVPTTPNVAYFYVNILDLAIYFQCRHCRGREVFEIFSRAQGES